MTAVEEAPTAVGQLRARGRVRGRVALLGPAFVASIAYVDPGNFATNFSGGARYGYLLLWVIVVANVMAMLVQDLSAKVGLATGRNLPELCREHFPTRTTQLLWVQAEVVAMATDLAEVVGGAIALNLLFDLPLFLGGLVTGAVALALLGLQRKGYRRFEVVITGLLAVILLGFVVTLLRVHLDLGATAHGFEPRLAGSDSLQLAAGILGATVMPHVIWLHSSLTQDRVRAVNAGERRHLLRAQRVDVVAAMGVAGLVNASMLLIAAALFSGVGGVGVDSDTLQGIHAGLDHAVGNATGLAFAVALLASGFASSGVGTLAGQVVMQGFVRRSVPLLLRRVVTLAPALLVLGLGADPTRALVLSQVVLSFGIPFALVPLVLLTRRRDVMGDLVNSARTTLAATAVTGVIIALNVVVIGSSFA